MDTMICVFAVILGLIGIIGSVVPGIPGPPLSWVGLLLLYFRGGTNSSGDPMSLTLLMVWLVITIVATILDFVVPAWFTKITGGSKCASWGAIIGLFVGMFIPPIGIIVGSLLGAFIAELAFAGKKVTESIKSSIGAFIGFIFGTGIKLISSGVMLYYIIVYL